MDIVHQLDQELVLLVDAGGLGAGLWFAGDLVTGELGTGGWDTIGQGNTAGVGAWVLRNNSFVSDAARAGVQELVFLCYWW